MIAFLFAFLTVGSAFAMPEAPIAGTYEAKIQIRRSWVRWEGRRGFIESDVVCEKTLELRLYDVRHRPHLRPAEKNLEMSCDSSLDGRRLEVDVTGKAEWLRPRDFASWVEGERDLLRVYFNLRVSDPADREEIPRLQEISGQEVLSEDLLSKSLIFRVAPPDLLGLTCSQNGCRNDGLPIVFRASVELKQISKKGLSFE
ncbi:MAG TPA: hypothetical protein PL182_10485 [Pseudobdellovibrionaceae bacterium]|nr:hypothetical protein [Pseudobdellovibrionaceae bacterium]